MSTVRKHSLLGGLGLEKILKSDVSETKRSISPINIAILRPSLKTPNPLPPFTGFAIEPLTSQKITVFPAIGDTFSVVATFIAFSRHSL